MNTLIDGSTQLILACNNSNMPWPSALTRVLTNFHIFACRAHIAIVFTYMETPLSLLSYYAHSILLCCSSGVSGLTMYGIVDTGACLQVRSILPCQPPH